MSEKNPLKAMSDYLGQKANDAGQLKQQASGQQPKPSAEEQWSKRK